MFTTFLSPDGGGGGECFRQCRRLTRLGRHRVSTLSGEKGALNVCGAPRIRRRRRRRFYTTTDGSCKRLRVVTYPIGLTDRVS